MLIVYNHFIFINTKVTLLQVNPGELANTETVFENKSI